MPVTPPDHASPLDSDAPTGIKQGVETALADANHCRQLMGMSAVLGVVFGFDGKLVATTPGWHSVLGYSPERLVDTTFLGLAHVDDLERTREHLNMLTRAGVATNSLEVRLQAADGSYRWIHWNLLASPEAQQIYGVGYDISERRLVEDELIHTREAALRASREKSRFLANISHEMRTPLNGILGMTALVLETRLTAEQREFLQLVQQSGDNLLAIINDILDISRIEAGRITLAPTPFALRELLEEMVSSTRAWALEKNLVVRLDVAPDIPPKLLGDPARIRQILHNLVSNAVKFTDSGWVHISAVREGGSIRFAVRDTGPGIASAQHELIFEPFRQGDDSSTRQHGGTGLGLSISRELTTMMGGVLWVESVLGEGATFHCLLPLPALSEDTPHDQPREASDGLIVSPLTLNVLVAEDNPINARVATRTLEKLGCRVTVAETGGRVLDLMDANHDAFDVILMDMQMPGVDGLQATAALRHRESQRALARVPIVALTANAMNGDRERCLDAGMDGYLSKPITLLQLEREIRRVTIRSTKSE